MAPKAKGKAKAVPKRGARMRPAAAVPVRRPRMRLQRPAAAQQTHGAAVRRWTCATSHWKV